MSVHLWTYYLQDDLDSFQQLLAEAVVSGKPNPGRNAPALHSPSFGNSVGSPKTYSPSTTGFRSLFNEPAAQAVSSSPRAFHNIVVTRADINRRDGKGMTILHHAASSASSNALGFAQALLAHPHIDLFAQDLENGWTALHRAFYAGSISIARAIIERESQLALGPNAPTLMKVKDHEGHGPYDLYGATIHDRTLQILQSRIADDTVNDDVDEERLSATDPDETAARIKTTVAPTTDLQGDELFTFGSNKNVTLGFGDEDDRQRPERVKMKRPDHLFKRFYREHFNQRAASILGQSPAWAEKLQAQARIPKDLSDLPSIIRSTPLSIQDVQMAKFHTAVLTNDPISNLYVCGHGLGGRLGTGSEKTEFNLVCLEDFGSERKKIIAVALGQDHTLAVTESGELFTWGSNLHGQLGIGLPKAKTKPEDAIQLWPKQLFGSLKREFIKGVAASAHHSVAHTSTALYTWGKNVGQLGLVDSGARSLEAQGTPRNVTPARFSKLITAVSAIDRATICLLESHDVFVFANYGCVRLEIPVGQFTNYFLGASFRASSSDASGPRRICKVTSGGDTICALSTAGEVYTVTVRQAVPDPSSNTTSTTNPNKIKASISNPVCVWSLKQDTMAARDVGVDQDGSVIISTQAGSVWRRFTRPKAAGKTTEQHKSKDYKFSRVPNLTRAIAVRASSCGAYCAIRQECNVTKEQIMVNQKSLWSDLFGLLSFSLLSERDMEDVKNAPLVYRRNPCETEKLLCVLSSSKDLEQDVSAAISQSLSVDGCDLAFTTSVSDIKIPVHSYVVAGRSSLLRSALSAYRHEGCIDNDTFEILDGGNGSLEVKFPGIDFLTLLELVLYMYTDTFVGFWQYSRLRPQMAYRYNGVRSELMRTASRLELRNLESAARRMAASAERSLAHDFDLAILDQSIFENGDALVQLADGEMLVHSTLLAKRCPFFESLFFGRAGGQWLEARRQQLGGSSDAIEVDLKHIEVSIFKLVRRYLYTDVGSELFDDIVGEDLDEFLDVVMEVLSVANELMLDRLSQVCQEVLGRHVTTRNVCQLLNAVAPCSITEFKEAALEYLCLNLEAVLANHWLDELEEDLLLELDARVRGNQLDFLPFARSGRTELELFERHPDLAATIDRARQAKLDALKLQSKFEQAMPLGSSIDMWSEDISLPTPTKTRRRSRHSRGSSTVTTPLLKARAKALQLEIEDELAGSLPAAMLSGSAIHEPSTPVRRQSSSTFTSPVLGPQAGTPLSPRLGPTSLITPSRTDTIPELPGPRQASTQAGPWAPSALHTTKLSMKEIMTQASTSGTSSLSSGLRAQARETAAAQVQDKTPQKLSQKERKKMQKQHSEAMLDSVKDASSPKSPWQTVSSQSKPAPIGFSAQSPAGARPGQQQPRAQSTPHLTMRQTVANTPPSKSPSGTLASGPSTKPSPAATGGWAGRSGASSPPSASKAVPIQSIRHASPAMPEVSPTAYMHQSLADIISQEQRGKDALKEAVAKRSLQEIQQEQAFQEWWDAESRAVQEAEAASVATASRSASSSRGGRGGRGGGGGGGTGSRRKRSGKTTATAATAATS